MVSLRFHDLPTQDDANGRIGENHTESLISLFFLTPKYRIIAELHK
jgi:hypothetical protein